MINILDFHPLANLFPLITGQAFDELVEDVRKNGVREPVWLYQGRVLDGRNRARAAIQADVECPTREYIGNDPVAFVVSLNLHRRHLDESQRAMVAGKLANLERGSNQHVPIGTPSVSLADAAEMMNVGRRSAARAREVLDHGAPELVAAVERGEVSVSAAAKVATLPTEQQTRAVDGGKELLQKAARLAAENAAIKADLDATKRRNQKRAQTDARLIEDRHWFGVEYQLECLHSVITKFADTAPACSVERQRRMADKWKAVADFFTPLMDQGHARH